MSNQNKPWWLELSNIPYSNEELQKYQYFYDIVYNKIQDYMNKELKPKWFIQIWRDRETLKEYKRISAEYSPIMDGPWTSDKNEIIRYVDYYTEDEYYNKF